MASRPAMWPRLLVVLAILGDLCHGTAVFTKLSSGIWRLDKTLQPDVELAVGPVLINLVSGTSPPSTAVQVLDCKSFRTESPPQG